MTSWQAGAKCFVLDVAMFEDRYNEAFETGRGRSLARHGFQSFIYDNGRIRSLDGQPILEKPPQVFLADSKYVKWWPRLGMALEETLSSESPSVVGCVYLNAIAFWPNKRIGPGATEWFLPEAFDAHEYRCESECCMLDDINCWIVERIDGRDRLWFDHQYQLRKRQYHPEVEGGVSWRIDSRYDDYVAVGRAETNVPSVVETEHTYQLPGTESWVGPVYRRSMLLSTEGSSVEGVVLPKYGPGSLVLKMNGLVMERAETLKGGSGMLVQKGQYLSDRFQGLRAPGSNKVGRQVSLLEMASVFYVLFVIVVSCAGLAIGKTSDA
jgi:hypothetical protein